METLPKEIAFRWHLVSIILLFTTAPSTFVSPQPLAPPRHQGWALTGQSMPQNRVDSLMTLKLYEMFFVATVAAGQVYLNNCECRSVTIFSFNPRRACAARGTVVGFVCVCYSQSHFSSVCSSQKGYDLIYGQWRAESLWGFLWKCSVAKLERFQHCTANA